jgi:hypothetical protein
MANKLSVDEKVSAVGMAAGVANTFWTVRDLVEMIEA